MMSVSIWKHFEWQRLYDLSIKSSIYTWSATYEYQLLILKTLKEFMNKRICDTNLVVENLKKFF